MIFFKKKDEILQLDKTDKERIDTLFRQNDTLLKTMEGISDLQVLQGKNQEKIAKQFVIFKEVLQYLFESQENLDEAKYDRLIEKLKEIEEGE